MKNRYMSNLNNTSTRRRFVYHSQTKSTTEIPTITLLEQLRESNKEKEQHEKE